MPEVSLTRDEATALIGGRFDRADLSPCERFGATRILDDAAVYRLGADPDTRHGRTPTVFSIAQEWEERGVTAETAHDLIDRTVGLVQSRTLSNERSLGQERDDLQPERAHDPYGIGWSEREADELSAHIDNQVTAEMALSGGDEDEIGHSPHIAGASDYSEAHIMGIEAVDDSLSAQLHDIANEARIDGGGSYQAQSSIFTQAADRWVARLPESSRAEAQSLLAGRDDYFGVHSQGAEAEIADEVWDDDYREEPGRAQEAYWDVLADSSLNHRLADGEDPRAILQDVREESARKAGIPVAQVGESEIDDLGDEETFVVMSGRDWWEDQRANILASSIEPGEAQRELAALGPEPPEGDVALDATGERVDMAALEVDPIDAERTTTEEQTHEIGALAPDARQRSFGMEGWAVTTEQADRKLAQAIADTSRQSFGLEL